MQRLVIIRCFFIINMLSSFVAFRSPILVRNYQPIITQIRASTSPTTDTNVASAKPNPVRVPTGTGAFKTRLPDLFEGPTHYKRALKQLKIIKVDHTIKNVRNQQRKLCAQTLDRLGQQLTIPLTACLDSYKQIFRDVHPFEKTVCDLVVISRTKLGHPDLETLLAEVKQLRMTTSKISKDYASRANNATSATEAKELLAGGMQELEDLYSTSRAAFSLGQLVELQKELRKIPVVELGTPTVVLVGAPNVGKSSIVRCVSTGTPEVNDYPFTTRGVTIGHVINSNKQIRYQVMDTPGLLDRPPEERNEMENLTFASLLHLPTAVIFVVDPSGLSGDQSSLEKQLNVRSLLRQRFPRRPWLDVISKGDLSISPSILSQIKASGVDNPLQVSVKEGYRVDELRAAIEALFLDLQTQLASM